MLFTLRTSLSRTVGTRNIVATRSLGAQRSFRTSRVVAVGKESAVHDEGRAEKVEAEKQQQLSEQKEGRGQWKEGLASDSEVAIKAEKDNKSIDEMQKEGAQKGHEDKGKR